MRAVNVFTVKSLSLALAFCSVSVYADHTEEMLITAPHDSRTLNIADEFNIEPDLSSLLKKIPGANVNSNGPLTGIPQYRGMFGGRVATQIDGMQLASAGPNWMDPPLSYATAGQLDTLTLYRGIAPVSVAQESIGGAVEAQRKTAQFDSSKLGIEGSLQAKLQSASESQHLNGLLFVGNNQHQFKASGMIEQGDDAAFPGGDISPTEYKRERFGLGYRLHSGEHLVDLEYSYNETGVTGTPALPMDIDYIDGEIYRVSYQYSKLNQIEISLDVFGSQLDHGMTNYHLRSAPANRAMWRQNIASSDNAGANLAGALVDDKGTWKFGFDYFAAEHQSDIDNPNNAMFFVQNFNGVERDVLGVFVERLYQAESWHSEFGLRVNRVDMDAGRVDATPALMMPPAQALRDSFNNSERAQSDTNFDALAKLWWRVGADTEFYIGLAEKTRSPSYQERYLWLPLQATAGLADGLTYTGNVELDPEVSRELESGFDFNSGQFSVSPRIFYKRVDDYIQGTSGRAEAIMMVNMMNMSNGGSNPQPLQFNNVEAQLYGMDMDWQWVVTKGVTLSGLLNYVRGERRDIDDNLYRIAPLNAATRLAYSVDSWSVEIESVLYASQSEVSEANLEQKTAGYGIVNLSINWQPSSEIDLMLGVKNILDKEYTDHLAGYNRALNSDLPIGQRLPGLGANAFASLRYQF